MQKMCSIGLCALAFTFAIATSLGAAGCSSAPPDPRPTAALGSGATDTPWPSDAFLVNGHIAVSDLGLDGAPASVDGLRAALGDLDGAPVRQGHRHPGENHPRTR